MLKTVHVEILRTQAFCVSTTHRFFQDICALPSDSGWKNIRKEQAHCNTL